MKKHNIWFIFIYKENKFKISKGNKTFKILRLIFRTKLFESYFFDTINFVW